MIATGIYVLAGNNVGIVVVKITNIDYKILSIHLLLLF